LTAESLRQNRPAALHDFSEAGPEAAAAFSRMLAPGGVIFGRHLARELDLSAIGSVIDIGGGPGTILVGLRERRPQIAATLMELRRSQRSRQISCQNTVPTTWLSKRGT
jgi:hypothetical protein